MIKHVLVAFKAGIVQSIDAFVLIPYGFVGYADVSEQHVASILRLKGIGSRRTQVVRLWLNYVGRL